LKLILGLIISLASNYLFALDREPHIRVRLAKAHHDVVISGTDLLKKISGEPKATLYKGKKVFQYNCRPLKNMMSNNEPLLLAKLSSKTGLLEFNKKKYRGDIFLVSSYKGRGCDIINKVNLETYISSLLPKEMNAKWPIEALKAQAVAARSYALYQMQSQQVKKTNGFETYYDLENSEYHQVNGSFFEVTFKTSQATRETKGEVLLPKSKKIVPIFFHSKCGGKTRLPQDVWSNSVEGYKSVECPFCHKHGHKDWSVDISREQFQKALAKSFLLYKGTNLKDRISIAPDDKNFANLRVYSTQDVQLIKKSRIRSVLGRKHAPSNYFKYEKNGNKILLTGKGYGHGVGLCQYGALELAKRGYTYKQILSHYFPEFNLKRLY
jgi:stage II sporulation protein D